MRNKSFTAFIASVLFLSAFGVLAQDRLRGTLEFEGEDMMIDEGTGKPWPVPPNGYTWHWKWPIWIFCTTSTQGGYRDNDGDGCVSKCDNVKLDGQWYHVRWVAWGVKCASLDPVDEPLEFLTMDPLEAEPSIRYMLETSPSYGQTRRITEWTRADGSKVPFDDPFASPREVMPEQGDTISFEDQKCPVDAVNTSMSIESLEAMTEIPGRQ